MEQRDNRLGSAAGCEHKWVHLRDDGTEESGYRRWNKVDYFFCERCLEQKRVSVPVVEKERFNG